MNQELYAQKLINQYSKKEITKLDELKALDKKVKFPVRMFAYIFGILSSLILGTGMCFAMNVIGKTTKFMILGIVIGCLGILLVSINYPIYKKMLSNRKEKYAKEIIQKSNQLLNK